MVAAHQSLPVFGPAMQERGDARSRSGPVAGRCATAIADRGPDAVTMDDIATAAGVARARCSAAAAVTTGLMIVLLDEDEQALQRAFLSGPAPLGPSAPPLDRLLAYGRARLTFVAEHLRLLCDAARDAQTRYNALATLHRTHVRVLLEAAGTTGDLDAQADALLALLDAVYVAHQLEGVGRSLDELGVAWESVARKLSGR